MICELCGKEIQEIYKTEIEGSQLNVCKECSKFGRIISHKTVPPVESKKEGVKGGRRERGLGIKKVQEQEIIEKLVDNFSELIRKAREKSGLNQQDFSKMLSVKESMLHKMETGEFKPSIALARRMERILKINLVEEVEEKEVHLLSKSDKSSFTIGDFVKVKKNKKEE